MSRYAITNIIFLVLCLAAITIYGASDISMYWIIAPAVAYLIINLVGSFSLSTGYFIRVVSSGSTSSGTIAITFDDGPIAGKTEKILDVLNQHNVKAAFFCIGHRIHDNADLAKRIHQEGHILGNHSYWHKNSFDWQSAKKISEELKETDIAIRETTGRTPLFFRPPFGVANPMVAKAVRQGNYSVIGWSVRSFDTVIRNKEKLFERVTRKLKSGDIVVFHDYSEATLNILPKFIAHASTSGLKIVRLDELLQVSAYE